MESTEEGVGTINTQNTEEVVEPSNTQNIEHLVELSNQVEFCEKQYIVHIVIQTLNRLIWEFTEDSEVELLKKVIIEKLLSGDLFLRLGRKVKLSDLEVVLHKIFVGFDVLWGYIGNDI